jgi:hypothetical protein
MMNTTFAIAKTIIHHLPMKPTNATAAATLCALTFLALPPTAAWAQGSLTPPPGPIAPVMKSLDQIEARTPLNTLPGDATATHIITLPGSYYFTGPINGSSGKVGIRIEAVNVTLDLNGFTLEGVGGSTAGIEVNVASGPVKIRNGQLRFWSTFAISIPVATQFVLEDLQISDIEGPAIAASGDGVIERVSISGTKAYGISADTGRLVIRDCKIRNVNATTGSAAAISAPYAEVTGCDINNVSGNTGAIGIMATAGSVVRTTVRELSSPYMVIGIRAPRIESCRITKLSAGTTGIATGIVHSQLVLNTQVDLVSGRKADGIATGDNVQQCDVRDIVGETDFSSGIYGRRVQDCNVSNVRANNANHGVGIVAMNMAVGNFVTGTKSHGIMADANSLILNNVIHGAGNANSALAIGIFGGTKEGVRIEGNTTVGCGYGIQATASTAVVVRNNARACDTNFVLNVSMPVVTAPVIGTNPNANVSQ